MSTVVLTRPAGSNAAVCVAQTTSVPIADATQFLLTGGVLDSATATIRFNGSVVATLSHTDPTFVAQVVGDYEITISGGCELAQVCTDPYILATGSGGGSVGPINLTANEFEYNLLCSSIDGRQILQQIDNTGGAATIAYLEMDGTPVADGSVGAACPNSASNNLVQVVDCVQEAGNGPQPQWTRISWFDGSSAGTVSGAAVATLFLDSTGWLAPVGPTAGVPCEADNFQISQPICYNRDADGARLHKYYFFDADSQTLVTTPGPVWVEVDTDATIPAPAAADVTRCPEEQVDYESVRLCYRATVDDSDGTDYVAGDILSVHTVYTGGNPNNIVFQEVFNQSTGNAIYNNTPPAAATGNFPPFNEHEPCEVTVAPSTTTQPITNVFVDPAGDNFSQVVRFNDDGTVAQTVWLDEAGLAVAAPAGATLAAPPRDFHNLVLCDTPAAGSPVQFIRRVEWDHGTNTYITSDVTLDGTTAYAVTGTVGLDCVSPGVHEVVGCVKTSYTAFGTLVALVNHSGVASELDVGGEIRIIAPGVGSLTATSPAGPFTNASLLNELNAGPSGPGWVDLDGVLAFDSTAGGTGPGTEGLIVSPGDAPTNFIYFVNPTTHTTSQPAKIIQQVEADATGITIVDQDVFDVNNTGVSLLPLAANQSLDFDCSLPELQVIERERCVDIDSTNQTNVEVICRETFNVKTQGTVAGPFYFRHPSGIPIDTSANPVRVVECLCPDSPTAVVTGPGGTNM